MNPFVWLAVHQLGYAWHDGRLAGLRNGLPMFVGGLLSLVALTHLGPYPLSLVGVPSDEISNTFVLHALDCFNPAYRFRNLPGKQIPDGIDNGCCLDVDVMYDRDFWCHDSCPF